MPFPTKAFQPKPFAETAAKAYRNFLPGEFAVITPKRTAIPIVKSYDVSISSGNLDTEIKHALEANPDWATSYPDNVLISYYEAAGGTNNSQTINKYSNAGGSVNNFVYNNQPRGILSIALTTGNVFTVPLGDLFFCVRDFSGADVVAKTQLQALNNAACQDYDYDPRVGNIIIFYQTLTTTYPCFEVKTVANAAVVAQTTIVSSACGAGHMACRVLQNGNIMFAWADSGNTVYVAIYTQAGAQVLAATSTAITGTAIELADLGAGLVALWILNGSSSKMVILSYNGAIRVAAQACPAITTGTSRSMVGFPDAGFAVLLSKQNIMNFQLRKVFRDGSMQLISIPYHSAILNSSNTMGALSVTTDQGILVAVTRRDAGTMFVPSVTKMHVGALTEAYQAVTAVQQNFYGRFRKLTPIELFNLNQSLQG